jgi:hypothetical protein
MRENLLHVVCHTSFNCSNSVPVKTLSNHPQTQTIFTSMSQTTATCGERRPNYLIHVSEIHLIKKYLFLKLLPILSRSYILYCLHTYIYIFIYFFPVTLRSNAVYGLLIHEISRSHTATRHIL